MRGLGPRRAFAGRDSDAGQVCQYSCFVTLARYTFDSVRSCVWVSGRSSLHPINTETRGITGWFEACDATTARLTSTTRLPASSSSR